MVSETVEADDPSLPLTVQGVPSQCVGIGLEVVPE